MNVLERKILRQFRERADELRKNSSKFIKNLSLNVSYEEGKIKSTFHNRPSDEAIKAFLVDIRHFLLEKEPTYFYSVCNLLDLISPTEEVKSKVRRTRKVWSTLLDRKKNPNGPPKLALMVGGKFLDSDKNMKAWINGKYFHSDEDSIKLLESFAVHNKDVSFFLFIDLLQRLAGLIFYLDEQAVKVTLKG